MASIDSFALRRSVKTAARSAAEAAVAGALAVAAAWLIWRGALERQSVLTGAALAWAASSASTLALLVSKATNSLKAFWWAFGGGMALRLAALAGLMAYGTVQGENVSLPALLLSYAFGVLFFLMLEYRHIKLK